MFPELCARVTCDHGAHCVAGVCVCPKVCPESSGELVCGSDAKTYQSECELQRAACGRDPKLPALHVIFYGDCTERLAAAALSTLSKLNIPFLRHVNSTRKDSLAIDSRPLPTLITRRIKFQYNGNVARVAF